ncbi:DUF2336 domain-containing protein [uncultured Sphingomonas sp.]|uniref:DUF2336 domain-containing protein n=1 Tax=uncultured Sphingomonas sp. TaxID=158754 RepID=UPI0035CB7755
MSAYFQSPDPSADAADALLRAGTAAMARAGDHERGVLRDLAMPDDHRLDEQTVARLRQRLAVAVAPVERGLRLGAAARLAAMQARDAAERLLDDAEPVSARLTVLAADDDAAILIELLAVLRLEMLAQSLPAAATSGADRPSLLVRLATCPEPAIAAAAAAMLAAQNRQSPSAPPPLAAAMREQIVWWAAALLRDRLGDDPRHDHALVEAAAEVMAELPADRSPAEAATDLAALLRARPDELPALLLEALGDRQPVLFVALLAQASGLDFDAARSAVIDPAGDRLWLLLRAQDLDRTTIARIGVALADADPRRDLDRFATALDAAMAIAPERAAHVFAIAILPVPYRDARAALAALR